MDVLYNIGSDCDYRVILYDKNSKRADCKYNQVIGSMLASLMDELGNYAISLTVMGIDFNLNEANSINFECLGIESINKDGKKSMTARQNKTVMSKIIREGIKLRLDQIDKKNNAVMGGQE